MAGDIGDVGSLTLTLTATADTFLSILEKAADGLDALQTRANSLVASLNVLNSALDGKVVDGLDATAASTGKATTAFEGATGAARVATAAIEGIAAAADIADKAIDTMASAVVTGNEKIEAATHAVQDRVQEFLFKSHAIQLDEYKSYLDDQLLAYKEYSADQDALMKASAENASRYIALQNKLNNLQGVSPVTTGSKLSQATGMYNRGEVSRDDYQAYLQGITADYEASTAIREKAATELARVEIQSQKEAAAELAVINKSIASDMADEFERGMQLCAAANGKLVDEAVAADERVKAAIATLSEEIGASWQAQVDARVKSEKEAAAEIIEINKSIAADQAEENARALNRVADMNAAAVAEEKAQYDKEVANAREAADAITDAWNAMVAQRVAATKAATDAIIAEDKKQAFQFKIGETDLPQYKAYLGARLAATEKYSDEYQALMLKSMAATNTSKKGDGASFGYHSSGFGMLFAGGIILTPFVEAAKAAAEFNTQLTKLYATAGETMPIDQLRQKILALSNTYGQLPIALTNALYPIQSTIAAMYPLESATKQASDGLIVLENAAKLARGSQIDVGLASNALTVIMRAYGQGAQDTSYDIDLLTKAITLSNKQASDWVPAFERVATLGHAAGIPLKDLAAVFDVVAAHSATASQAGTQLYNFINRIVHPTQIAEKAFDATAQAAQRLGQSQEALNLKMIATGHGAELIKSIGLEGVFRTIANATDDSLSGIDKLEPDIRTAAAAMKVLSDNGVNLVNNMKALNDVTGANAAANSKQTQTLADLEAKFQTMAVTVGQDLIPAMSTLIKLLDDGLDVFNKFPPDVQQTVVEFGAATGALMVFLGAGTLVFNGLTNLRIAIGLVILRLEGIVAAGAAADTALAETATAASTTATEGAAAFAAGGPYMWALGAVIALIGGIAYAWVKAKAAQEDYYNSVRTGVAKTDAATDLQHKQTEMQNAKAQIPSNYFGSNGELNDMAVNAPVGDPNYSAIHAYMTAQKMYSDAGVVQQKLSDGDTSYFTQRKNTWDKILNSNQKNLKNLQSQQSTLLTKYAEPGSAVSASDLASLHPDLAALNDKISTAQNKVDYANNAISYLIELGATSGKTPTGKNTDTKDKDGNPNNNNGDGGGLLGAGAADLTGGIGDGKAGKPSGARLAMLPNIAPLLPYVTPTNFTAGANAQNYDQSLAALQQHSANIDTLAAAKPGYDKTSLALQAAEVMKAFTANSEGVIQAQIKALSDPAVLGHLNRQYTNNQQGANSLRQQINADNARGIKPSAETIAAQHKLASAALEAVKAINAHRDALKTAEAALDKTRVDNARAQADIIAATQAQAQKAMEQFLVEQEDRMKLPAGQSNAYGSSITASQYQQNLQGYISAHPDMSPDDQSRVQNAIQASIDQQLQIQQQFTIDKLKLMKGDTASQINELDLQYAAYAKNVDDKIALDQWYAESKQKITDDSARAQQAASLDVAKSLLAAGGSTPAQYRNTLTNALAADQERMTTALNPDDLEDDAKAAADLAQQIASVDWGTITDAAKTWHDQVLDGTMSLQTYIARLTELESTLPTTSSQYQEMAQDIAEANKDINASMDETAKKVAGAFKPLIDAEIGGEKNKTKAIHDAYSKMLTDYVSNQLESNIQNFVLGIEKSHEKGSQIAANAAVSKNSTDPATVLAATYQDSTGKLVTSLTAVQTAIEANTAALNKTATGAPAGTGASGTVSATGVGGGGGNATGSGGSLPSSAGSGIPASVAALSTTATAGAAVGAIVKAAASGNVQGVFTGIQKLGDTVAGMVTSNNPKSAKAIAAASDKFNAGMEIAGGIADVVSGKGPEAIAGGLDTIAHGAQALGAKLGSVVPGLDIISTLIGIAGLFGGSGKVSPAIFQKQAFTDVLRDYGVTGKGIGGTEGLRSLIGPESLRAAGAGSSEVGTTAGNTFHPGAIQITVLAATSDPEGLAKELAPHIYKFTQPIAAKQMQVDAARRGIRAG